MNSNQDKLKRWRPWQFSVSTLLVLMLAAGCFLGGWMAKDRRRGKEFKRSAQGPALDTHIPTPDISGAVIEVSDRESMVQLSVGKQDGVRSDMRFDVYAGSTYKGRIEVVETQVDTSVARILREYTQQKILQGDSVATKMD